MLERALWPIGRAGSNDVARPGAQIAGRRERRWI